MATTEQLSAMTDKALAFDYTREGIRIAQHVMNVVNADIAQAAVLAGKTVNPVLDEGEQSVVTELQAMFADMLALQASWQATHADILAWKA